MRQQGAESKRPRNRRTGRNNMPAFRDIYDANQIGDVAE
jgi:hypothetical protein